MKVSLDLDDFSILNNHMDRLLQIKEHYPDFKVSLFTIPYDYRIETKLDHINRDKALKLIHENLDWLEIIPHGLTHMPYEMDKIDYQSFKDLVMPSIKEALDKDGLPLVKGFKAPYWLWNEGVIRALDEAGWWGAVDRNHPDMLRTKKYYVYSHSIDEVFFKSNSEVLKLHGHVDGVSNNDLDACILNILKLPADVTWHFASEFVEESK